METKKGNTNSTLVNATSQLKTLVDINFLKKHPLSYLSLSDLISLHGWIDSEADLIEALGGDNTAKLEKAREQMVLVHQEIERRRSLIFGTESEF